MNEVFADSHYMSRDVFVSAFTTAPPPITIPSNTQKKRSKEYTNELVRNAAKATDNYEPTEFQPRKFTYEHESTWSPMHSTPHTSPNRDAFLI